MQFFFHQLNKKNIININITILHYSTHDCGQVFSRYMYIRVVFSIVVMILEIAHTAMHTSSFG